ncbi:MAG: hypothetical protein R3E50_11645 [Halioglobus sp.]
MADVPEVQQGEGQTPAIKIYKYTNRFHAALLPDRAPMGIKYEIMQLSCFACNPKSTVDWGSIPAATDVSIRD